MKAIQRHVWQCFLAAAVVSSCASSLVGQSVRGISIVVPNTLENSEGNFLGNYPFDGYLGSMRYQQVYDASQFSSLPESGGFIQHLILRIDGSYMVGQSASAIISNLQVNLSTTSRGPDSLSPVFAENVGADD